MRTESTRIVAVAGKLHPAAVRLTGEEARRARPLLDRLAVRLSPLAIAISRLVLALPPRLGDPVLRFGHHRSYESYNRRDWEVNVLYMDESLVFRAGGEASPLPGLPEVAHGIDGYLESQLGLIESFEGMRVRMEDYERLAPRRLAVRIVFSGAGTSSGIPIEQEAFVLHEFVRGRLAAQTYWWDREAGRDALGLLAGDRRR